MIAATPNSTPSTTPNKSDSMSNMPSTSSNVVESSMKPSGDSIVPKKKKMSLKTLIGVIVLVLVLLGSGAGFYMTQYGNLDLRQQAWYGQSCTVDSNCNGWPNEKCDNGTCVPTNTGINCPAFSAWGNCDPTPGTDANECTGSHYSSSCQLGYKEWRCGNKQWIPDYGNPANNECASQCAWDVPAGEPCCPTGGDACNPATDNYKCIADPYVSHCESWSNSACPASQQGYWKAIEWCVGAGCECGPGGLFEGYSGPGCDCGGGGISCNDRCDTTAECQTANSAYSCVTASDGLKRCRLASNPTSATCGGGTTSYSCNSDCSTTPQCQGDLGGNYSCVSGKCRLTSNPSSASCTPTTTSYQCNSNCSTTPQCQGDLGGNYSCVSGKCRLTSNPSSASCQPSTTSYQCDSACTTTAQCQGDLGDNFSCVSNKCRLTSNPTSATCEPGTTSYQCNSTCSTTAQCQGDLGARYSCVSNRCRLTDNPSSASCEDATTTYACDSACQTTAQCQGDLGNTYSCVSNKCRLTDNPTSPTCQPAVEAPMCKDVAILDRNNNELDPKDQPSPFFVGQIVKFRCAADDPASTLIDHYEFKITEPDGTVVDKDNDSIDPGGKSAMSLEYTINQNGSFSAQCRLCLTTGCQDYVSIGTR